MRHMTNIAYATNQPLFEMTKQNQAIRVVNHLKKEREQDPGSEAYFAWATNTVSPIDGGLKVFSGITLDDVASYARKYLVDAPVSVVYEGRVDPSFPDHAALAAMRSYTAPVRIEAMDRRVEENGTTGTKPDLI
jgi:hypothetical protein